MGQPAAKQGDLIQATDTHIFMIGAPPVPTPLPCPFNGMINGQLSTDVKIMGQAAAVQGSTAQNNPPHLPQGGPFQKPPTNQGKIMNGSVTVLINGKAAARNGDTAQTCNDPVDMPVGQVVATGTVLIG